MALKAVYIRDRKADLPPISHILPSSSHTFLKEPSTSQAFSVDSRENGVDEEQERAWITYHTGHTSNHHKPIRFVRPSNTTSNTKIPSTVDHSDDSHTQTPERLSNTSGLEDDTGYAIASGRQDANDHDDSHQLSDQKLPETAVSYCKKPDKDVNIDNSAPGSSQTNSMATLYASLARVLSSTYSPSDLSQLASNSSSSSNFPNTEQFKLPKSSLTETTDDDATAFDSNDVICKTCGGKLPTPCTPLKLAAHQRTFAHRIYVDSTPTLHNSSNDRSSSSIQHAKDLGKTQDTRKLSPPPVLSLRPSNKGYGLLSQMGWTEGMGLGREEWDWKREQAQKRNQRILEHKQGFEPKSDARISPAARISTVLSQSPQEPSAKGSMEADAISISSGDSDYESNHGEEQSQQLWLKNLPHGADDGFDFEFDSHLSSASTDQHCSRLQTMISSEHASTGDDDEAMRQNNDSFISENNATSKRRKPNLVPIAVQIKRNRAGLGLEASRNRSPSEHRKSLSPGPQSASGSVSKKKYLQGRRIPSLRKTKSQRRKDHDRVKRDWMRIRASLN